MRNEQLRTCVTTHITHVRTGLTSSLPLPSWGLEHFLNKISFSAGTLKVCGEVGWAEKRRLCSALAFYQLRQ